MATRWLSYTEAAKRVGRSSRNIRRWRAEGMPMEWRTSSDGRLERVVDEEVLLAWFRDRLNASPVHQYRMRRIARNQGLPGPITPPRAVVGVKRENRQRSEVIRADPDDRTPIDVLAQQRREAFVEVVTANSLKTGAAEYAALQEALKTETPACDGLAMFTEPDTVDAEERALMAGICEGCPVVDLCRAFADASHAPGFWAGRLRRASRHPDTSATSPAS